MIPSYLVNRFELDNAKRGIPSQRGGIVDLDL